MKTRQFAEVMCWVRDGLMFFLYLPMAILVLIGCIIEYGFSIFEDLDDDCE